MKASTLICLLGLIAGVVNRGAEPIVNSKGEDADLNNDGIYNDPDFAIDIDTGGGLMTRSDNPNIWGFGEAGGSLVPDWIDTRDDIRSLFRGINFRNSTGFGPHSSQKRTFDYVLADFDHIFSDELSVKFAFAFEDIEASALQAGWSSNQLLFSSGYGQSVLFPTLRSIKSYNNNPSNLHRESPYEAILVDLTNANFLTK